MQTTECIDVAGNLMAVELLKPNSAKQPWPAVVLCHHREGVDEFTLDAAHRIASHGFAVAVPNFYHRRPAGEDWSASRKAMQDREVVADLGATVDFLGQQAFVRADAIGIAGHCMGGRTAYLGAGVVPQFKSAVILYGGHIFKTEGEGMPAPIAFTKDIRADVLALYGDQDHIVGVDEIDRLESEMKAHNVRCDFHIYANAGHAFQDFSRSDMYRKDASEKAWNELLAFLRRTLA